MAEFTQMKSTENDDIIINSFINDVSNELTRYIGVALELDMNGNLSKKDYDELLCVVNRVNKKYKLKFTFSFNITDGITINIITPANPSK